MTKNTQGSKFERIKVASLDVAPILAPVRAQYSWLMCLIVIVVIALALAVFLWIPTPPQGVSTPSVVEAAPERTLVHNVTDRSKQSSPWQEAQWAKQRRLSQQALGDLLDKQAALEKMAVERWGAVIYRQALQLAEHGDELYRTKDYVGATDSYQQGAKQLETLLAQADSVFNTALSTAFEKLLSNDADASVRAFELALAIEPEDALSSKGLFRAKKINQILALKSEGEALERDKQLDNALLVYQQALQLDPDTLVLRDSINSVNKKIKQRNFTRAMAVGFSALQNHQFTTARNQFQKAISIKISEEKKQEALAALEETANQQTLYRIAQLRQMAKKYEQEENWQKATSTYQAILTIDSNLDFAKAGLVYSQNRQGLEDKLITTIKQAPRLADNAVYHQATMLYKNAASINTAGPVLTQHRETLARLLKEATTPVDVELKSDTLTDVTVFRVAHIGNFANYTLSLKPGIYTVMGSRDGYRDVRQEFKVVFEQPLSPIVIECLEKIL
ncbi:MAG: tetratricopeptide repeat protein [Spongiibacteraceae bacterium]|nr:tetratricopeptide repeat protein [Spongiibacteraceae bacterium]